VFAMMVMEATTAQATQQIVQTFARAMAHA